MAIKLSDEVVIFFNSQNFAIVSTIDKDGYPSNACKGIVEIDADGYVYLMDLYKAKTYQNLIQNPHIGLTAIDEHGFAGYCLKGNARIIPEDKINPSLAKAWEDKITSRLTHRLIKNIHGEKGHSKHPEAALPKPQYLIAVEVEEAVDLTPHRLNPLV